MRCARPRGRNSFWKWFRPKTRRRASRNISISLPSPPKRSRSPHRSAACSRMTSRRRPTCRRSTAPTWTASRCAPPTRPARATERRARVRQGTSGAHAARPARCRPRGVSRRRRCPLAAAHGRPHIRASHAGPAHTQDQFDHRPCRGGAGASGRRRRGAAGLGLLAGAGADAAGGAESTDESADDSVVDAEVVDEGSGEDQK